MSERTTGEIVVDVVEWLGALVACVVIGSLPLTLSILAGLTLGAGAAALTFAVTVGVVIVLPAVATLQDHPELDGYGRWGRRMGRFVRWPFDVARLRRSRRSTRALSSSTAASSAAAPSLPPTRR